MNEIINETICPFCKAKNNCMAHSEKPCWCIQVKVPQELLELVPENKKRKTCICLTCIQTFKDNPKEFIDKIARNKTLTMHCTGTVTRSGEFQRSV